VSLLSGAELRTLTEEYEGWCVSIFMPTHRTGVEIQQDPIRLKNLLGEVEEQLVAGGLRAPVAQELLEPAQRLLRNSLFWRHQRMGWRYFSLRNCFAVTACRSILRNWWS
jgi:hypothetical protein